MSTDTIKELEEKGTDAIEAFTKALSRIRTGRANLSILEPIRVDAYGSKVPINQVATMAVTDPRLITVKPFDKSLMSEIDKALRSSPDLGITPQNDGERILLAIPPLTEERRREFTKTAKSKAEEAKIAIRNARREVNDRLKAMEKDGSLPEDDSKKAIDQVQKRTDELIARVDEIFHKKEKEIMEV